MAEITRERIDQLQTMVRMNHKETHDIQKMVEEMEAIYQYCQGSLSLLDLGTTLNSLMYRVYVTIDPSVMQFLHQEGNDSYQAYLRIRDDMERLNIAEIENLLAIGIGLEPKAILEIMENIEHMFIQLSNNRALTLKTTDSTITLLTKVYNELGNRISNPDQYASYKYYQKLIAESQKRETRTKN
ncbi:MAG: hypothetical protein ABI425_03955 [Patescibacteria group bacterium]